MMNTKDYEVADLARMESALINAEHAGQGAKVNADPATLKRLRDAGMIAAKDGLTRKGTIVRERLISAKLDELF